MNKHELRLRIWSDYDRCVVKDPNKANTLSMCPALEQTLSDEVLLESYQDDNIILDFPDRVIEILLYSFPDLLVFARYKDSGVVYRSKIDSGCLALLSKFIEADRRKDNQGYIEYMNSRHEARFDGDIVITDPCYVCPGDSWASGDRDARTGYGFQDLFSRYIWGDTIYGDWGCTTYRVKNPDGTPVNPGKILERPDTVTLTNIGNFCADSGLVGVFYLAEAQKILGYGEWTRTIIRDFHGTIKYVVDNNNEAHIIGITDDGEGNFLTLQTSL